MKISGWWSFQNNFNKNIQANGLQVNVVYRLGSFKKITKFSGIEKMPKS